MQKPQIPKIIHYCWFGHGDMSQAEKDYIASWKRKCPEYKFMLWNEDNFDIHCCRYVEQAASAEKWSFVSDYVRLFAVYNYGGIYLDTDVELLKGLDDLLGYEAFIGFENCEFVNDGQGFGAVFHNPIVLEMMEMYRDMEFIFADGSLNLKESPRCRTEVLLKHGLIQNGERQTVAGFEVFPVDYMCPIDYMTGRVKITSNTYSIHHYRGSWHSEKERRLVKYIQLIRRIFGIERGQKIVEYIFTTKDRLKKVIKK